MPFDPANEELNWRLGLVRYFLAGSYGSSKSGFREQLDAIYRWTWGGHFSKLEPGVWVTRRTTGIIRKGKNTQRDANNRHLVVVDHEVPLVLQFAALKETCSTNQEIYDWLAANNRVVHIHAEEDAALTAKGWRDKKRPRDAYDQLGIEVYFVPVYDRNKPIPGVT